jgi:GGDEF domain-containing protein
MPLFPTLTFRRTPSSAEARDHAMGELPEHVRHALPMRFEAVGEALLSQPGEPASVDVVAACAVVGRDVARDGAALGEALSGLRSTYRLVRGEAPAFEATEALSVAWSDATLEYLHDLSCEDPLTGLASLAHLRTRLDELYREAELTDRAVAGSHALVIVELCFREPTTVPGHHFTRALRLVQVTEAIRAVYSGGQTIARLGLDRAVALVPRSRDLGTSVALLRDFLGELDLGAVDVRVWIEGLPSSADSGTRLLDELAR